MEVIPSTHQESTDSSDPLSSLFSLVAGEGDGLILGVAAGGAWELGYSAITEQVTVIAYQLIEHGSLDLDQLVRQIRELDGSEDEENVYRAETPHFRAWLDRAAAGSAVADDEPSLDGFSRTTPLGVVFRRQPAFVASSAVALGRMFHQDASSVAAGVISAAAVAASCFGQSGRDLIVGVAESVVPVMAATGTDLTGLDRLSTLETEFQAAIENFGVTDGHTALELLGGDPTDPIQMALTGLLLAAPMSERYHGPIEQAVRVGGTPLGAGVGAIVGARVGIRAWPWAFANDTWFAELGRRLVRGPAEIRDLPIPYAVEQHLMKGDVPGFH